MKQAFFPRMSESARSGSQFRLTSVHWPLDADFQLPQESRVLVASIALVAGRQMLLS